MTIDRQNKGLAADAGFAYGGWQDISTAPKDGTLILAYDENDTDRGKHALNFYGRQQDGRDQYRVSPFEVVVWIEDMRDQWHIVDRDTQKRTAVDWSHWARSQGSWEPTHWMPLPAPPSASSEPTEGPGIMTIDREGLGPTGVRTYGPERKKDEQPAMGHLLHRSGRRCDRNSAVLLDGRGAEPDAGISQASCRGGDFEMNDDEKEALLALSYFILAGDTLTRDHARTILNIMTRMERQLKDGTSAPPEGPNPNP